MKKVARRAGLPAIDYLVITLLSVLVLYVVWSVIRSPYYMLLGDIVARVDTTEKVIALTLDDGPLPGHTGETLALLADQDIPATFFVIGKEAAAHPEELKAIVTAGHTVGNHGYNHHMLAFLPPAQIAEEVEKTDQVIRASGYTGVIPFRTPYNLKFIALPLYLERHDRPDISRDVMVKEGSTRTAEAIAADIVTKVRPGSIILLHPMYDHTASSRAAIPLIVKELKNQGYTFVSMPELLNYK